MTRRICPVVLCCFVSKLKNCSSPCKMYTRPAAPPVRTCLDHLSHWEWTGCAVNGGTKCFADLHDTLFFPRMHRLLSASTDMQGFDMWCSSSKLPTECSEVTWKCLTYCFFKPISIIHLHCGRSARSESRSSKLRGALSPIKENVRGDFNVRVPSSYSLLLPSPLIPLSLSVTLLLSLLTHANISLSAEAKADSGWQPRRQSEARLLSMHQHVVVQVCVWEHHWVLMQKEQWREASSAWAAVASKSFRRGLLCSLEVVL